MNAHRTWLIARRELRERLAQKAFRIALVVGLVLSAAVVALPALLDEDDGPAQVRVPVAAAGGEAGAVAQSLTRTAAQTVGLPGLRFRAEPGAGRVRALVRDGDADVGVIAGADGTPRELVVREDGGGSAVQEVLRVLERYVVARRVGAPGSSAATAALLPAGVELAPVEGGGPSDTAAGVTSVLSLLLYLAGLLLMTTFASGLIGDRAGRVTERLLTAARPVEHLAGKLIGVGAAGVLQLLVWMAGAVAASLAVSGGDATSPLGELPTEALVFFPFAFIGTYVLYAALAAVLVLPARKTEDVGAATAPATILQIAGFVIASSSVAPGSTISPLAEAASLVPFFAPLAMFARLVAESVPAWQIAVAAAGPFLLGGLILTLVAPAYARHAIDAPPGGKGLGAALRALRS